MILLTKMVKFDCQIENFSGVRFPKIRGATTEKSTKIFKNGFLPSIPLSVLHGVKSKYEES